MERLLDYFIPEKYILNLGINKFDKKIGGTVVIYGEALEETIKFHAVGLKVGKVLVEGKKAEFEAGDGVLKISKVPVGKIEIVISYLGSLNENMEGAYLSTYDYDNKKEIIVTTQFESHYAREAFPCIDEPAAKAEFSLKLTVPEADGELVLANTSLVTTKKYHKVPDGKY